MPIATTRIPEELAAFLKDRATLTGESVSEQIRHAVEEWAERQDTAALLQHYQAMAQLQAQTAAGIAASQARATAKRKS
jgi:Arc/MetJ-type ribon-helix-helix transcriptional regulator